MELSNLQKLVNEVVKEININPDTVIKSLLGNDKKALLIYNMANKAIGLDNIIKFGIASLADKTPEQYQRFETLIMGVINGEPEATEGVKELIMGVVNV